MVIQTKNPATEEVEKTFEEISDSDLGKKIEKALNAFLQWKKTSFAQRAELMKNLAGVLKKKKREYGEIITREMGKPITSSIAEIEKCALVCEFYAENSEKFLADEKVKTDASESFVRFEPMGVILAVMPWNFPFWQVIRFASPTLMAGNVGLLKHASNVPQSSLALEEAFLESGFFEGVFQSLLIGSSRVEGVIQNPIIKAVTLTGSEYAGSQVAMQAGREIKKTVLELGGSDPFIVLSDAEISKTCEVGATARLQSAGQSCIAAKRFIVVSEVLEEFIKKFKKRFELSILGDPLDEKTSLGPVASESALEGLLDQINASVKLGAEIVTGGKRWGNKGYFLEPTILKNVKPEMPAYSEEMFGPVASVIEAKNEDDAVRIANDSEFGLGASLWTKDLEKAKKIIPQIESGAVFVNGMTKSDPRLPFGGVKKSGYGRELSHYGIKEFVSVKSVWVK